MRAGDRLLQRWRIRMARPWIPPGSRVLDIGCFQGELFANLGSDLGLGIGLDPEAPRLTHGRWFLLPIPFQEPLPFADSSVDSVVLLATMEHLLDKESLVRECRRLLRPGGRVVATVPSIRVDQVLKVLVRLRVVDGMDLESHHGFDPRTARSLFESKGFTLEHARRFQLGLNHLFVWRRAGAVGL